MESARSETTLRQAQLIMLRILRVVDDICRKHDISYWLHAGTLLGAVRHGGFIPWDDDLDIAMTRQDFHRFAAIDQQEMPDDLFFQTSDTDPAYRYILPKVRHKNSRLVEDKEVVPFCQGIYIDVFPFDSYPNKTALALLSMRHRLRSYRHNLPKRSIGRLLYMASLNTICLPLIVALYGAEWTARRWRDSLFNKPDNRFLTHGVEFYNKPPYEKKDIFPLKEVLFEGYSFFAPGDADAYLSKRYGDYMQLPPEDKRSTHAKKIIIDVTTG